MRATHFGQLYRLIIALLLCAGCSSGTLEPVAKLDYELPMVGARIVDNRYLIGFDLESEPTALVVSDLQDPLRPMEVSRWPWPKPFFRCQFDWSQDHLYRHCEEEEATDQRELSIIDVSDPFAPRIILHDKSDLYDYHEFIVEGRYMYTLKRDAVRSYLVIWKITDPAEIHQISSLQIPLRTFREGLDRQLYKRGDYLIFGGADYPQLANLFSVDVSDPLQPQIVSEYTGGDCESPSGFSALTANQQYLFIGRPNLGLCIVDISDPLNLHTVSVLREESPIISLVVEDSTLFMLGFFHLRIVDISNPEQPRLLKRIKNDGSHGVIYGDYFYSLDDISDVTEIFRINQN